MAKELREYLEPEMKIKRISFADIIVTSTQTTPEVVNNETVEEGDIFAKP